MAASIAGVFQNDLQQAINSSKVFVVGAGGIGCEILKNLVMSGFNDIEIIDLDTIDVSNLNRQFLFHKQHVGKSKAEVARESALSFNPTVNIKAYHDSIMSADYGVNFFKRFAVVMNALDNRMARNHVNRMCLAADVPLIESGTAGYEGQVELIKKQLTQCYECLPKAPQKTYPGCTIRNTPSEPIHCIVWSKHLFNQLFGENDPDMDVSPDTADPDAAGDAGMAALKGEANDQGNVTRVTTREWAVKSNYDPEKLFRKLFHDDIKYLLSMGNLWKNRTPPKPLVFGEVPDAVAGCSNETDAVLKDQKIWSVAECVEIFSSSCRNLYSQQQRLDLGDNLVWDKDDKDAMDFVASCANIRAYIFGIPQKSRNIIPAIATSNAIVAGLVVLKAFYVLRGQLENCQSVYLRNKPNHKNVQIVPEACLVQPNSKCYVCSPKHEVQLCVDVQSLTVKELEEQILKKGLHMVAPDVITATGTVILSSEEGETTDNYPKTLSQMGVVNGSILKADDFLQNYELNIVIVQRCLTRDGPLFEIIGSENAKPGSPEKLQPENGQTDDDDDDVVHVIDGESTSNATSSIRKRKLET
ncbi:Ubiquitin-like modifier-activating enzyme 5 [Gryllus bimaculatus]|nr:Ubiquitin-like modifier-activating enzyme 5 [Gryllus bimaculatus]